MYNQVKTEYPTVYYNYLYEIKNCIPISLVLLITILL